MEIAAASRDLAARANSGTLRNDEYSGTTFSVSNMGMFDIESFTAIIFPPHAAILAVGTVKEQPVVRDGELAIAQIMDGYDAEHGIHALGLQGFDNGLTSG